MPKKNQNSMLKLWTLEYVVFGGDHLDYLTNDLWVFDPKIPQWRQLHPKNSPEPRADHLLMSDNNGKITMRGGYLYNTKMPGWTGDLPYVHAGPGDWIYDIISNSWQAPANSDVSTANKKNYRLAGFGPDHFTEGEKPNAAAHENRLANIPKNIWVNLETPKRFAYNRDWGTLGFDLDRDMIYWYNGGHCSYSGADVTHYHLATNRWDQLVETEFAPGYLGGGESVPGWSFNRRPWIPGHSWNSYTFDSNLKKLVVNGRQGLCNKYFDQNTYFYNPSYGDWEERKKTTKAFDVYNTQVRYIPGLGSITWYGQELFKLNENSLDWEALIFKGKLTGTRLDHCGYAFDSLRKKVLFFSGGTYEGTPYSGLVDSLDISNLTFSSFTPIGSDVIGELTTKGPNKDPSSAWFLREVVYHPISDLFIFNSTMPGGYLPALDPKKNSWVGIKLPGYHPIGESAAIAYDSKRDLFYVVGANSDVCVLRLDPKTMEVKTFSEIAVELRKTREK